MSYDWQDKYDAELSTMLAEEEKQQRVDAAVERYGWDELMNVKRWWDRVGNGPCPNCGADFRPMPPEANIYPHWSGACKETSIAPAGC